MSRTERFHLRLTPEEKIEIKELACKLGYDTITDYLLSVALNGSIVIYSKKEKLEMFKELNKVRVNNVQVENNINQIAKHLNTYEHISSEMFSDYLNLLKELIDLKEIQNEKIKLIIDKFL